MPRHRFTLLEKAHLRLTGFLIRKYFDTYANKHLSHGRVEWDQKQYRTTIEVGEL